MNQNSFVYSVPYLIVVTIYLMLSLLIVSERNKYKFGTRVRIFCVGLFVLFIGLRGFVGSDCYPYYYNYQQTSTFYNFYEGSFEPGFVFIFRCFKTLGFSYAGYLFIITVIEGLVLDAFFKRYSPNYAFGWLAYFSFGGLILSIDLQRNILSICMFLISIPYLWKRKFLPYLILNLIGTSFHASAILYLPFYFIATKQIEKRWFLIIFITCNVLFLSGSGVLSLMMNLLGERIGGGYYLQFQSYMVNYDYAKGFSIGFIERTITFLLIYYFSGKLRSLDKRNVLFINMFLCYYVAYFLFADNEVLAVRISLLFKVSYWILIPALYYVMQRRGNRNIYIAYLSVYALLWTAFTTNNIDFKYENQLTGISSYQQRVNETNRRLKF